MSNYLLSFWLDDGVARYLPRLKAIGIYGENEEDVVRSLIRDGVVRALERGVISIEFADVEEAPTPPEKPPCPECNDMWSSPGACPKCGNDGIPFISAAIGLEPMGVYEKDHRWKAYR